MNVEARKGGEKRDGGRKTLRRAFKKDKKPRAEDSSYYMPAPTLVPLVVGFVLLLALVLTLGVSSTRQLDRVSGEVLDLQRRRGEQLRLLIDLRAALTELNDEARNRASDRARGGIILPFAVRLRGARARVADIAPRFRDLPLIAPEEKESFARDLDEYLDTTESTARYNLEGFERFRSLDARLERFRDEADAAQEDVARRTQELQREARESIRTTMVFALLAGLVVAAGTIYEVQRRFRQVRASLDDARREREFSTQVLEGMPTAVATFDAVGNLRSANKFFFRIFPRASVGASLYADIAAPEAKRMLETVTAEGADGAPYRGRWELYAEEPGGAIVGSAARANVGAAKTFDAYIAPVRLGDGDGLILTLVDVTEATAAEEALRRQASLAAVGQAAAQVAHEIKNPLGSIRLGVSLLREMARDADMLSTINLIERGIEHLNKLTVDVTQYSRGRPLELARTNLNALIDSSLELVRDKVDEKRIRVERRYTEDLTDGDLDADQLRQVFVNLIANAIEASDDAAPVRITTELRRRDTADPKQVNDARTRRAIITIADKGSGMSDETREHLFEPFFTTKQRGTGLGLAVSKKIVEQHDGTIEVASKPGEGTTFTIELPM